MNIDFDAARWSQVRENYRKWWAGELNRPLINIKLSGRDSGREPPKLPQYGFTSFYDLDIPAEEIVDCWVYSLASRYYPGDAFPSVWPNFGPGVIAALLGLNLQNGKDTVWFTSPKELELKDIHFEFDRDNPWFRRLNNIYQAATERFQGLIHLGMTDIGGNLDILQSFRPSEKLLLDLYDAPEQVEKLTWEAHEKWWQYFEHFAQMIQGCHPGYTAWTPIYSEEPYYILQCDFCYMIGPDMFERFVKPELQASCRKLKNAFYHLDGPGQLVHLDSLLSLKELKGIQWVPGDGQPGITEWPEVYKKIHQAGKLIQISCGQDKHGIDSLEIIAGQLGDASSIIMLGEAPLAQKDRVDDLLKRYGV